MVNIIQTKNALLRIFFYEKLCFYDKKGSESAILKCVLVFNYYLGKVKENNMPRVVDILFQSAKM